MPLFRYKAYNEKGKEISGTIDASSIQHAKKLLQSKNLLPYEIVPAKSSKKKSIFSIEIFGKKKIPDEELALLLYEIGLLLEKKTTLQHI